MRRLADHFKPALPSLDGTSEAPTAAERESDRPPLRSARFKGLPIWFHPPGDGDGTSTARTDDDATFDPDDAIACLQYEHYVGERAAPSDSRLRSLYYFFKPALPRGVQLALQRENARRRLQAVAFPHWPEDTTLDRLLDALLADRMRLAGIDAVPFLGFWPHGATWAWCLTHDVDTGDGQRHVAALAGVEEERGLRSSWYFVPERYRVDRSLMEALRGRGHEIGVHGLQHTGKLFTNRAEFESRVGRINDYVREWRVVGFRSPATYRNPYWLPEIEVDYDSSYMDVATLEPQRGGICGTFPFMLSERLVELPITLPMDHTLLNVLRAAVLPACATKLQGIRARHGLALALFHPDYNATAERRASYGAVLDALRTAPEGWGALPHEIANWWQRRRRSRVVFDNGTPRIDGPAAKDGSIWWAHRDGDGLRIEPGAPASPLRAS